MKTKLVDVNKVKECADTNDMKVLEDYLLSLDDGTQKTKDIIVDEMTQITSQMLQDAQERIARRLATDSLRNTGGVKVVHYHIRLDKYLLFLSIGLFLLTAFNFYVNYIQQ